MWAARIVHQAALHDDHHGNSFVTLTYREPWECNEDQLSDGMHVPSDFSLQKSHFRNFMKRFRNDVDQKVKYFQVGEYGRICKHRLDLNLVQCPHCNLGRPHHHAILFNWTADDLECYGTKRGEPMWTSPFLEDKWGYGFVDVGEVNFKSAAYCARYSLKKVNGMLADDYYLCVEGDQVTWLQPEFVTMSRGGRTGKGIAHDWYQEFKSDVFPSDETPVPGIGVLPKAPRYYLDMLAKENQQMHDKIKAMRLEYRKAHGDEFTPERLEAKYRVKKAQISTLEREL